MISSKTRKLIPYIQEILKKIPYPFPIELILSVIQVESAGNPGVVNSSSGASGLMQIMPGTLDEYNKYNKPISLDLLRSTTKTAITAQLQVGLWVMGRYLRAANKYLLEKYPSFSLEDLIKLSDNFYAAGPFATKKKIKDILPKATEIEKNFPNWSPVNHSKKVWNFTISENPIWDMESMSKWLNGIQPKPTPNDKNNAIFGLLILVIGLFILRKKKDVN